MNLDAKADAATPLDAGTLAIGAKCGMREADRQEALDHIKRIEAQLDVSVDCLNDWADAERRSLALARLFQVGMAVDLATKVRYSVGYTMAPTCNCSTASGAG